MAIECYNNDCPKHASHTDPESGPYCSEDLCTAESTQHEEPHFGSGILPDDDW